MTVTYREYKHPRYCPSEQVFPPAVVTPLLIPTRLWLLRALLEGLSGDFLQSQVPSHTSNPRSLFCNHGSFITQSDRSQLRLLPCSSDLAPFNFGLCPEIQAPL